MSQQNEMLSKPSHMEVAAKTWALDKAREIRGQVVDGVLNQTQATVGYLGAIRLTEDYMEGFLAAWLARNLMDFTRVYYSDMEERLTHAERLAQEAIARNPLSVTITKGRLNTIEFCSPTRAGKEGSDESTKRNDDCHRQGS